MTEMTEQVEVPYSMSPCMSTTNRWPIPDAMDPKAFFKASRKQFMVFQHRPLQDELINDGWLALPLAVVCAIDFNGADSATPIAVDLVFLVVALAIDRRRSRTEAVLAIPEANAETFPSH
jgi:hypothetical protein